ncbi:MAG: hypothetical protein HY290_04780 [Planctomycetia bacterium]|nr:hypothetical protein [Planctomycetia bacterium]
MEANSRLTCPMCGAAVESNATKCGGCGENIVEPPKSRSKIGYTPERAYRISVRPIAALFAFGGAIFLLLSVFPLLPITHIPFVRNPVWQRFAIGIVGAMNLVFGVGLFYRYRAVWIVFLAYLGLGTCIAPVAHLLDPPSGMQDPDAFLMAGFGALINGMIAVGLYFAMRPAFQVEREI